MVANKKQQGFFGKLWLKILRLLKMDLIDRRNLAGYVFILPFVIGLLFIFLPSIFQAFVFSLNEIVINSDGGGY